VIIIITNHSRNPTTKRHATVSIQQNIVTCPTYPAKFIQDSVALSFYCRYQQAFVGSRK